MNKEDILNDESLKYKIKSIANKFYNVEKRDLYQAGYMGALKALKSYDPTLNISFSVYASKYIFGEMYELVSNSKSIKLNKNYLKIYKQIVNASSLLSQKLKHMPSKEEISLFLEIDIKVINEVIMLCDSVISLDEESELLNDNNFYQVIGKEYDYDTSILVNDSLNELDELGKKVIDCRYFKDLTQQETAELLGLSQVKVSRLESKSKRKMKEYICA